MASNDRFEAKIDEYRAIHGKVISVVVDDTLMCFRRATKAEMVITNKASRKQPELAIEHAVGLCRMTFLGPGTKEDLDKMADKYPLLFAGSDQEMGISDHIIKAAHGEATVTLS